MSDSAAPPSASLSYSVADATPHSGNYVPENIIPDDPQDAFSRWSSAQSPGANTEQWLLLRLDDPAILKTVTFGKFYKPHPCAMKEFKVYAGVTADNLTEIIHSQLNNDSAQQTFSLQSMTQTRYVKVVPISLHGCHKFHVSIWHVSMTGISKPAETRHKL